jgi:transcription elongation factor
MFKNFSFLYNHDFPSTNGIFVEKTENLEIMGAELLRESNDYANSYGSKVNIKTVPEKFKELIGNPVKITGGNWKGYLGTLKSVNDKTARVELTSKAKIVSVDKNFIAKPGEISRNETSMNTPRGSNNFKTPAYYPQSPYNTTSPRWNAGGQTRKMFINISWKYMGKSKIIWKRILQLI